MKLVYNVKDKPKFGQLVVFAIQQLLAIMAATIIVPVITNGNTASAVAKGTADFASNMDMAAALFGAGIGTIVYLLFTQFKSPVFLGSSFAFLGSMAAAFSGGIASVEAGYAGLILGAVFAGLVYVIIALIVKFVGSSWIDKLMPAVVIGPTVAIIGLTLASSAVSDLGTAQSVGGTQSAGGDTRVAVLCGIVTLLVTIISSVYGKKTLKMIPFIIGIISGYAFAAVLTVIGIVAEIDALKIINFEIFEELWSDGITLSTFFKVPEFTFMEGLKGFGDLTASNIATVAVAYVPVAFVVFAEHIADHKNISSIIESDLLQDPGLHRTLLGDGVGSMAGAFFGGCPNTTYGESVGCVAISGNASVVTILATAIIAIIVSFISPFNVFLRTIPKCVMGGVCMALYGFIAVSGLKMVQKVDLEDNRNLFVVSAILISGIGGLSLTFGKVQITAIACALILGIIVNLICGGMRKNK